MARPSVFILAPVLLLYCLLWAAAASAGTPGPQAVYVVPVKGAIDTVLAERVMATLHEAAAREAALVILEVETPGGRLDAALRMKDAILSSRVPVVAFVNRQAWSAGALVTLAARDIAMAPGSSIGASEPRPADEKTISAVRAAFESTAEATGRDPRLAAAMVDAEVVIEGVVERGELLTLTGKEASDLGLAFVVRNRAELLDRYALAGSPVIEVGLSRAERVARILVHPFVAPILLTAGFVGVLLELFTPGFGLAGGIGLASLALFFGGHIIAGFAGWEVVALFTVGLLLLLIEVFMPGFGVFGIAGAVAVVASIFLAAEDVTHAIRALSVSVLATVGVAVIMARHLGRRGLWARLALRATMSGDEGYLAARPRLELVGQEGVAVTNLRPAGVATVGGERLDVVTGGEFIPAGAAVEVVKVEGGRIVVSMARKKTPTNP